MFKLFICAVCQVEMKPGEGISVHADSSKPGRVRPWDGPFLCPSCQTKKEAMEGKRPQKWDIHCINASCFFTSSSLMLDFHVHTPWTSGKWCQEFTKHKHQRWLQLRSSLMLNSQTVQGEVYHLSSCVKLWWNWRFSTFFSVGQFADPFLGTWSLCLPEDGPFYNSKNSFYVHRHVNTGAKWLRSDCVIGKQVEAYVWLLFIFPLFIFFHYFTWTLEFGFFAICYEPKLLVDLLYSFDCVSTESIGI